MNDKLSQSQRIRRSSRFNTDDDGRTTLVESEETANLELVSTQMLMKVIVDGDAEEAKKLRKIAGRDKDLQRMVNSAKHAQRCGEISCKFGVRVPRNCKEAVRLDFENGNTLWQDAVALELK